jgi:hypothetical protein
MPGNRINNEQVGLYMSTRTKGCTQVTSSARAGISERTGRRIENGRLDPSKKKRHWKTRVNLLDDVWETVLIPLLEQTPHLQPLTLLEYLQEKHPEQYPDSLLRTLQRRVKTWKSLNGNAKTLIFRQEHTPGRQGLSDFTQLKDVEITIAGKSFKHLLYHFRLAFSGWSHMKVILGGESYSALATGLQEALWRLGASPLEHRTDSLSAAFKNLDVDAKKDLTARYEALCEHYNMTPTRNNLGVSHENGSIEGPHGHLKRRIKQALLLRQSNDFESIEAYQSWLDVVVHKHNQRNAKNSLVERGSLQPLPLHKTADYTEVVARVHSTGTIDVKRTTYSVPSRLSGEKLRVHLYDDRLECYLGSRLVIELTRIYAVNNVSRARKIDYRHLIESLVRKPQAFRFSKLRDDILPTPNFKKIWAYLEKGVGGKLSCKLIVGLLSIAAKYDCETALSTLVINQIEKNIRPNLDELDAIFCGEKEKRIITDVEIIQHNLDSYDDLLMVRGVAHE